MAIKLEDKTRVMPPNGEYPYGQIKDRSGEERGTPVNAEVYGDIHQFFAKLMDAAAITHNGVPDNAYDGFQLYEDLRKVTRPYKVITLLMSQTGTGTPNVTYLENTVVDVGLTYSRASAGFYNITFPDPILLENKSWMSINITYNNNNATIRRISNTQAQIVTYDAGGNLADGVLNNASIEVRIYD